MQHAFGVNRTPPGAMVRIVPGVDHGLSTDFMRNSVVPQVADFLEQDLHSVGAGSTGTATFNPAE